MKILLLCFPLASSLILRAEPSETKEAGTPRKLLSTETSLKETCMQFGCYSIPAPMQDACCTYCPMSSENREMFCESAPVLPESIIPTGDHRADAVMGKALDEAHRIRKKINDAVRAKVPPEQIPQTKEQLEAKINDALSNNNDLTTASDFGVEVRQNLGNVNSPFNPFKNNFGCKLTNAQMTQLEADAEAIPGWCDFCAGLAEDYAHNREICKCTPEPLLDNEESSSNIANEFISLYGDNQNYVPDSTVNIDNGYRVSTVGFTRNRAYHKGIVDQSYGMFGHKGHYGSQVGTSLIVSGLKPGRVYNYNLFYRGNSDEFTQTHYVTPPGRTRQKYNPNPEVGTMKPVNSGFFRADLGGSGEFFFQVWKVESPPGKPCRNTAGYHGSDGSERKACEVAVSGLSVGRACSKGANGQTLGSQANNNELWVASGPGRSCDETCQIRGRHCDGPAQSTLNSPERMDEIAAQMGMPACAGYEYWDMEGMPCQAGTGSKMNWCYAFYYNHPSSRRRRHAAVTVSSCTTNYHTAHRAFCNCKVTL